MPQGSKSGLLLFDIYCSDIPVNINNDHVEQYADDSTLGNNQQK